MKGVKEGLEFETRVGESTGVGAQSLPPTSRCPDEKNEEYPSTQSGKEPVTRLVGLVLRQEMLWTGQGPLFRSLGPWAWGI